jgi:hypothetical protein
MSFELPPRPGKRPRTTPCAPHTQFTQNSTPEMHRAFKVRAFELPFVRREPSGISVPGPRPWCCPMSTPVARPRPS